MAAHTLTSPDLPAARAQVPPLPADPARVPPIHLPALCDVAADLDGLDTPVKIVPPTQLGVCVECSSGPLRDLPVWDAVAVVRALDPYGYESSDEVCPVHLHDVVAAHVRRERLVVVDVPATEGRPWFERSERETFYAASATDPLTGIAATRGIWDAWQVVEVVDGLGAGRVLASVGLRDGESFNQARGRAEMLAQAVAAVRAADAYEASFSDAVTVTLPVVAVTEVAAA